MSRRAGARARGLLALACLAGCGDNLPGPRPGLEPDPDAAGSCQIAAPDLVEPLWIAGEAGPREELGAFGKPDAIWIDARGVLLAGDEDPDHEELLLFDTRSDRPAERGDPLTPLADLGADPGPAGSGPLEFAGIAGLAENRRTGLLYVVEQGNARVQRLVPLAPFAPPYYASAGWFGVRAPDPDAPRDGELVRPQAARVDRLGHIYLSDDARGRAPGARRDLQVFSPDGDFLFKLGDPSYGPRPGVDGRLGEPENFALDQVRDRIYVCDELTREVVVYRYSDRSYLTRFDAARGIPNGIDVDQHGFIYVMDEGTEEEPPAVRIFDPDTLEERWSFGAGSGEDDLTPGAFRSPDTLVIDQRHDLLVVADQGHQRIQGFSLSELQSRACIASARLVAPAAVQTGGAITLRLDRLGPTGAADRSIPRERARLSARRIDDGSPVALEPAELELHAGVGVASVRAPGAAEGELEITASLGGLRATGRVNLIDAFGVQVVSGPLPSDLLHWRSGLAVYVVGEAVVPAGFTLIIEPGVTVLLEAGARLRVDGALLAEGTADFPIQLAAADPDAPWAQLHLRGAQPSVMRHVLVSGGGDTPRLHHCCGPVVRLEGAELLLEDSVLTGGAGKGLLAEAGSRLAIRRTAISRMGMGAELIDTDAVIEDSHLTGFAGPDDNDALYLRGETRYEITRTVMADASDDLLDTLAASPILRGCMIYGAGDKAVSLDAGDPIIEDTLIAEAPLGIAIKNVRSERSTALVRRSTITAASDACVSVFDADGAEVLPVLEQAVVWDCGDTFRTAYDEADLTVNGSVVQALPAGAAGDGNSTEDPLLLDPPRDWRTHPLSPARQRPGGPAGWPGP